MMIVKSLDNRDIVGQLKCLEYPMLLDLEPVLAVELIRPLAAGLGPRGLGLNPLACEEFGGLSRGDDLLLNAK